MDRIIIEYQSHDSRQLSKQVMAAVMDVLEKSSVSRVYISQDGKGTGSRNLSAYAGGGSNGI